MPNDPPRLLRKVQVLDRTGLGRTTLYNMIRAGAFPAPTVYLSPRLPVWREADVTAWIDARIAASPGVLRTFVVERMTLQRKARRIRGSPPMSKHRPVVEPGATPESPERRDVLRELTDLRDELRRSGMTKGAKTCDRAMKLIRSAILVIGAAVSKTNDEP
jgi:prophage regulatory protein